MNSEFKHTTEGPFSQKQSQGTQRYRSPSATSCLPELKSLLKAHHFPLILWRNQHMHILFAPSAFPSL